MIFKNEEIIKTELGEGVSRKVLAHGGKMMAAEVSCKKGSSGPAHSHEHEQVSYILSGKFNVTIDGKETILAEGDSYYVPANIIHGAVALEDGKILDVFTPQRDEFLK